MVEVGDVTMTAAEARLRLALADPAQPGEIRGLIDRLRGYEPVRANSYDDPVRKAAKLLAKLDARSAR